MKNRSESKNTTKNQLYSVSDLEYELFSKKIKPLRRFTLLAHRVNFEKFKFRSAVFALNIRMVSF